jgi:HK97 family phage prohead protease
VPWHVSKSAKCPASKPWAVIKNDTGEVVACHASEADAQAQVAALYANDPGAKQMSVDCGCAEREQDHLATRAVDNTAWDGPAAMSRCSSSTTPATCFGAICAARVSAGDAATQAGWALPHHKNPGSPPNAKGVSSALGYVDRTDGIDKAAARKHLEVHATSIQAQSNAAIPQEIRERRAVAVQRQPTLVPAGAARSVGFPSAFQIRKVERNGKQMYHLHGTATAYEQLYEMWDAFGPYKEGVRQRAGAVSLAKPPDVAFLVNHKGITMARTTNNTLELAEVDTGLDYDAWVNADRQDVRDLASAVDDGLINESSFAFMITRGSWNDDYSEYWIEEYDIDRGDVSAVNYGANPYTSVAARTREILADLDQLPLGAQRAALERLSHRPDLTAIPAHTGTQTGSKEIAKVGRSVSLVLAQLALDED